MAQKPYKMMDTATHLALTGLVDVVDDNVTVGPVAPLIRRTFDLEWVEWQRKVDGIGEPREEDKTPLNVLWSEPKFRSL